jgi:triacylglycerol lipase
VKNIIKNNRPAIFVHGLFGFGPKELGDFNYWGTAFKVPSPLKRFEASVGPLSSAHDRACELAAQIKGTVVDYGSTHSAAHGHSQHGVDFTGRGFLLEWNEHNPLHLIGHSLGSQTCRCLQYLLEQDFWGWGSTNRWVCSLSAISGSSNGSIATYFFGAEEKTGLISRSDGIAPILRLLELYTYFTNGLLEKIYDFNLHHWGYTRQDGEDLINYLKRVAKSRFLWESDNGLFSATLQGAYRDNGLWSTFPKTYYFSTITEQTLPIWFNGYHYPSPLIHPALYRTAVYIGRKKFTQPPIPIRKFNSSEWWENDGLVSTVSQMFPHTNGKHPVGGEFTSTTPANDFKKGRWYYEWVKGKDHGAICISPRWWQRKFQSKFYEQLFSRLAELDIT